MTTCIHPHYDDTPASRRLRAWHLVEELSMSVIRDGCVWVATVRTEQGAYMGAGLTPVDAVEDVANRIEQDLGGGGKV